jgi:5-methylcytosine-specific restriction endonuclease McrA
MNIRLELKEKLKLLQSSRPNILKLVLSGKMSITEAKSLFREYHYEQEHILKEYLPNYTIEQWIDEDRKSQEYNEWRSFIFQRDGWKCQHCQAIGGELNAHHIKHYKDFPELRLNVNNGITLCLDCHKKVHKDEHP